MLEGTENRWKVFSRWTVLEWTGTIFWESELFYFKLKHVSSWNLKFVLGGDLWKRLYFLLVSPNFPIFCSPLYSSLAPNTEKKLYIGIPQRQYVKVMICYRGIYHYHFCLNSKAAAWWVLHQHVVKTFSWVHEDSIQTKQRKKVRK